MGNYPLKTPQYPHSEWSDQRQNCTYSEFWRYILYSFLGSMAFPSLYQDEESGNGVGDQFMDNDTSEVYFNLM